jgi:hypothetical protein
MPHRPRRKRLRSLDEFEPPPWHRKGPASGTLSRPKFMALIATGLLIGASIGFLFT